MIAPKYEAFSQAYTKAVFLKLDVDEVPDVAEKAEVRAMPTFQIYVKGQKVDEIVGADPSKLEIAIKKIADNSPNSLHFQANNNYGLCYHQIAR